MIGVAADRERKGLAPLGLLATQYQAANTYGWDTVSAVKLGVMNNAIAEAGSSPEGYSWRDDTQGYGVTARFGHWRIGYGGDGRMLHMELPLEDIEVWYGDKRWSGAVTATVQVELHFLPPLLSSGSAPTNLEGGRLNRLVIRDRKVAPLQVMPGVCSSISDDDLPVASVLRLHDGKGGEISLDLYQRAIIKQGLQDWLADNLAAFSHVFATVSVYQNFTGDFAWLKPTYVTYHFQAHDQDPEQSVFAILAQTGGRTADQLAEQISPFAIPPDADAAFLISPERMLGDMLMPALPAAFEGLKANQLEFDEGELEVKARTQAKLKSFEHDGKKMSAVLETLQVRLQGSEMLMESQTACEVSRGVFSVCSAKAGYHIGLVRNSNGEPTLAYRESRDPIFHDFVRKSDDVALLEKVLGWITAVAGILAFVPGVNGVAVPVLIIAALVSGGGLLSMKLIQAIHRDDAPPLNALVDQARAAVTWPQEGEFELRTAELNGALQIAGVLHSAKTKDQQE